MGFYPYLHTVSFGCEAQPSRMSILNGRLLQYKGSNDTAPHPLFYSSFTWQLHSQSQRDYFVGWGTCEVLPALTCFGHQHQSPLVRGALVGDAGQFFPRHSAGQKSEVCGVIIAAHSSGQSSFLKLHRHQPSGGLDRGILHLTKQ